MFKNMKIEINEQQPLDEVVKELERLGYKPWCVEYAGVSIVVTNEKGNCTTFHNDIWDSETLTTLAELKDIPSEKTMKHIQSTSQDKLKEQIDFLKITGRPLSPCERELLDLNDFGFDFKQQPSNTVELGMQMLEEGVK